MKNVTDKEISAFHARFCPFADRVYRSAIIATGNLKSAKQLQVDVYLKAFVEYLLAGHVANFKNWLAAIASECFADHELQNREMPFEMNAVYQAYRMTLKKLIDCQKQK
ncbi:hypothetical protein L0337_08300 [candidate division KSB1 bacterium]|nr:hypothetical protein [candidate division KSB1 bacterium]